MTKVILALILTKFSEKTDCDRNCAI